MTDVPLLRTSHTVLVIEADVANHQLPATMLTREGYFGLPRGRWQERIDRRARSRPRPHPARRRPAQDRWPPDHRADVRPAQL